MSDPKKVVTITPSNPGVASKTDAPKKDEAKAPVPDAQEVPKPPPSSFRKAQEGKCGEGKCGG
ncbi:HvfA family oxazolone/thioamide-modified RiPP metallophore [Nannocystis punicea]|uniref:Uncharacterized protein n=1 Tax=Nannocystis punicea TaxID=2995304 RepID=A0ABY7H369_9BACT|nr:hypothetical protein [Nannocystis poenicansa]WAS93719.1 hypothetical protein O0S08_46900 [Nannocystis poenicansa]